jgi:hypothetical protein
MVFDLHISLNISHVPNQVIKRKIAPEPSSPNCRFYGAKYQIVDIVARQPMVAEHGRDEGIELVAMDDQQIAFNAEAGRLPQNKWPKALDVDDKSNLSQSSQPITSWARRKPDVDISV